jgi:hypothetical protein
MRFFPVIIIDRTGDVKENIRRAVFGGSMRSAYSRLRKPWNDDAGSVTA